MTPATPLTTCPLCASAARFLFATTDLNRRCSDERFRYRRCEGCRLIFLENRPDDIGRYYAEEYYATPPRHQLERAARAESYQLDLLRRHVSPGRLVEVGPAWGVFSLQAASAGFQVQAIEMDARCCAYLTSTVGVEAINSDRPEDVLRSLPPSRAVVLWQVLEHLPQPWECLESAIANLEPQGVLLVATPNPDSLGFRLLGPRWPHVDAPRHYWLFPIDTLSGWLAERGMERQLLTTSDLGARRWNRFAWQRLFMNRVSARPLQHAGYAAGFLVGAAMRPLERQERNGSSYTAIFRKVAA